MPPPGPYQEMDKIQAPFVVQNPGHLNLHQFGAYDLFENAATPDDRKSLIIGPAEYGLPCMHWQLEALAFFEHILHGAENGYAQPSAPGALPDRRHRRLSRSDRLPDPRQ
jgi:uncharacterized protein